MKRLVWQFVLLLTILCGCASLSTQQTLPANTTEQLLVAQWSLVGATNAVADLKGTISQADYDNAKSIVLGAATALSCAKGAAGIKVNPAPTCPQIPDKSVVGYIALANSLLLQAANYYAKRGE